MGASTMIGAGPAAAATLTEPELLDGLVRRPRIPLMASTRFNSILRSLKSPSELPYDDGGGGMSTPDTESRGCTLPSGLTKSPPSG